MLKIAIATIVVLSLTQGGQAQVNGNWGGWGSWSTSTVTCGSGVIARVRVCDSPSASNGGNDCSGTGTETSPVTISEYCLPSVNGNVLLGCAFLQFGCGTGNIQCIDADFRCDGKVDCDDGTDENHYFAGCSLCSCNSGTQHSLSKTLMLTSIIAVLTYIQLPK